IIALSVWRLAPPTAPRATSRAQVVASEGTRFDEIHDSDGIRYELNIGSLFVDVLEVAPGQSVSVCTEQTCARAY
ncbi:hypothetical protein, partial [Staphylococcus pseudintermedius]|uniref:hypothetical protein n=1 Tax=Staphylococcus pseudintermedius TaxID=283734 RepID=UPI0019D445A1